MLSDYINSCESIKTTVGGESGRSQGTGGDSGSQTSSSQQSTCTETSAASTCTTTPTSQCPTSGTQTNNCQQASAVQLTTTNHCNTVQPQTQSQAKNSEPKCSLKEFCQKITKNGTCKVLKEIECKDCGYNNSCVNSDGICTKFISVTMEQCEKEAECLIIQLNEDLSPELLNTIVLRFIGLQLYLRIIQEFSLLRDYFTKIIENLEKNYNAIKSCTCGSAGNNCSKDGKCLCTIFYKLFQATKSLHDRYCKIINYMKGASDEDLYKVIPSLSLTRSIILLTSYFNDYINSGYMVEESSCGCGYNEYIEPSLFRNMAGILAEIVLLMLSTVTKTEYIGLRTCPCHKYSSKLDDVVTLLQTGIDDTDDCDGLLSDVISMVSPLVKDKYVDTKTMDTTPSTTNKDAIEAQLQTVNQKKCELNNVIPGINGGSKCEGTAVGTGAAASSGNGCASCLDTTSAQTTSSVGQTTTGCNGAIDSACSKYTGTGVTTGCDGSTTCECKCEPCKTKPGKCCCFYKHSDCPCDTADNNTKTCLMSLVKSLSDKDIKCNNNGKDCLMCYLCVLKCSIGKLKEACNVGTGSNGDNCNLNDTLKDLPDNISKVVDKICGDTSTQECCKKCSEKNGCNETGTCQCSNGKCCEVNDRFSNFTKFLLGTCSTSTSNNCKTIANTLIALNTTLGNFINGNGASTSTDGCTCTNGGTTQNCTNNCCCGKSDCDKENGCKENKPISILCCVIKCGLKGIKERSDKIVKHITNIETCLKCICDKMNGLENCYCGLHKCISKLGKCVKDETDCLRNKICKLKEAKNNNQKTFKDVIDKSREVLSDICGLYRVYSIESYSYYLSPYYDPISP